MQEQLLFITAASVGFLHTILGPDHYLPFIVIAKARKWSSLKTFTVTALAGTGHVLGSVAIGMLGVAFGITLSKLEWLESSRGNLAAWMLIAFGLVYLIYGIRKAYRNRPHQHFHHHANGILHLHDHNHNEEEHLHIHEEKEGRKLTPWVLFVIFVFGPCEALIPILMYPAVQNSLGEMIIVTAVFGITTVATMLSIVMLTVAGIRNIRLSAMERYMHAFAGAIILLCGLAMQFLGL
jgi:sulfite exporter TauE/SafE